MESPAVPADPLVSLLSEYIPGLSPRLLDEALAASRGKVRELRYALGCLAQEVVNHRARLGQEERLAWDTYAANAPAGEADAATHADALLEKRRDRWSAKTGEELERPE